MQLFFLSFFCAADWRCHGDEPAAAGSGAVWDCLEDRLLLWRARCLSGGFRYALCGRCLGWAAHGTPMASATGRDLARALLACAFDPLPPSLRDMRWEPAVARSVPVVQTSTPSGALRLSFPPPRAVLSVDGSVTLWAIGSDIR